MKDLLGYLFAFLVFPGLVFSGAMGLLVGWIDRKVTARIQWRVGPPWYQNFADVFKLALYKETLIPEGASRAFFLGMPLLALAGATLVSTILLSVNAHPAQGFVGDLIVVVYLLLIPPVALMLGAFASANPLASLGASREMKLMLAYELPFILALVVPMMRTGYSIKLGDIIMFQQVHGAVIESWSGKLSMAVMLLCIQAKLGFVPFDMSEAETEIMSGTCIEYSGKALAILKLAKAVTLFSVPFIIVTLYFGGLRFDGEGLLRNALQYISVLIAMILIKNTNPRVRIDQALGFFWKAPAAVALIAVILACLGK
jgi:NADH-quinone oxidoreductase subunit H